MKPLQRARVMVGAMRYLRSADVETVKADPEKAALAIVANLEPQFGAIDGSSPAADDQHGAFDWTMILELVFKIIEAWLANR